MLHLPINDDAKSPQITHLWYRRKLKNKLLADEFISPIGATPWLFAMVIIPKDNRPLHICIHFWKVNATTRNDHYPSHNNMKEIVDNIANNKICLSIDFFLRYYQVGMA